jgi:hypothetical protein
MGRDPVLPEDGLTVCETACIERLHPPTRIRCSLCRQSLRPRSLSSDPSTDCHCTEFSRAIVAALTSDGN